MHDSTDKSLTFPTAAGQPSIDDPLTEVLRRGTVRLLAKAVEAEVTIWIDERACLTDEQGHR